MELKELTDRTCEIFGCSTVQELGNQLMLCVTYNNTEKIKTFHDLVEDLRVDWLQKIFQYYQADRKEKMQDYTPKSLAYFVGMIAGDSGTVIDMCAGSGSLTIQKWNQNNNTRFVLYEFDEKVIPFLLFNMMLRNIECTVYHADVLQNEIFHAYKVSRGDRYGVFKEVQNGNITNF